MQVIAMPWGSMGTIWAEIGLNYAGLVRGMQEATRQIEAFDRDVNARFRAIGESFSKVGRSLSLGITAPLATLGGFASKAAMGFESAMANVWTIADVTKAELASISAQIEAMSLEVPQSAQQLAEGLYDAIGSGISDVTDAMKVLEVAAKAGQAGASDTATAMDALTSTINAYGLAASDASRLADIMFRAVDRGKLTFAELAGNIGDVISTAATAKVPFEEIAAAFATLTKGGVNAAESATAVNQAILSIIQPSDEAAKTAKSLGIEFNANALAAKGFAGVLEDVLRATGGNIEALSTLFPNVRALKGVLGLIRNDMRDYASDMEAMAAASGATERAYQKQVQTMASQTKLFQNEVAALGRAIGSELLQMLNSLMQAVKPVIEAFTNLPGPVRQAAVAWGMFAAALGPATTGIGALIGYLTGPMGLVLAVSAVVAAIAGWVRASQDLDGKIERQVSAARRAISEAMNQAEAYESQARELDRLIKEYEELQGKPDKSQQEHERLRQVIDAIVELAPQAVTGYDDMGRALIGNADAAKRVRDELWQLHKEQLELAAMRAKYELPGLEEQVRLLEPQFNKVKAQLDEIAPRYYKMREVVLAMSQATSDAQREQILQAAIAKGIFDAFSPPATQFAATEQSYNKLYSTFTELSSALLKAKTGILELKNAEKQLEEWRAGKPAVTAAVVPSTSGTGTALTERTLKVTADELSEFEKFNAEVQKLSSESYGVLKQAWADVARGLKSSDVVERALAEERASKLLGILKDKLAEYGGEFPKSAEEFGRLFKRAASAMSAYIKAGWQELEQASDMEAFTKWSSKIKALSSDAFGVLQEAWADIERGLKAEDPAIRSWAELRARDLVGVIEAALGQFEGDWLKAAAAASIEVKSGYQRIKEKAKEGQSELAKAMATLRYRVSVEGLGIEEQVKELETIQQTDAYRRASVEEQRQLEMQLAGLREELRQKNVRGAYEEYQFYAELYDYDAQNHIDHLNRILQNTQLNTEERKKLSQELALWEKKQKDEEAAYKKKVEDAWNTYYLESGKKTKADLLREELRKREAELEAARKTGKGIELAEAAVAQAKLDLNKQIRQDEEDRFRFLVQMGALSTKEQLEQIQKWLAMETEGSTEWRKLKLEELELQKKVNLEAAQSRIKGLGPIDQASLDQLKVWRTELGQAYDAAVALGVQGEDAAKEYARALEEINGQIDKLTKHQEELGISQAQWEYEQGLKSAAAYKAFLEARLATVEKYGSEWIAIQRELAQVESDINKRNAEAFVASLGDLTAVEVDSARERLLAEQTVYAAMGEKGKAAVEVIKQALEELDRIERNRYDDQVERGELTTEQQIAQVRKWLAAAKEGSDEWKRLRSEEFRLLKRQQAEIAEAKVTEAIGVMPVDRAGLEAVKQTLGAFYDEARKMGPIGEDAATKYAAALEKVNQALEKVKTQEEKDAEEAQRREDARLQQEYQRGQVSVEQYKKHLSDRMAALEAAGDKWSTAWLAYERELTEVTRAENEKAAQAVIDSLGDLETVHVESAKRTLEAERAKYAAMGYLGEGAVKKIDDALKVLNARVKATTDEVRDYVDTRTKDSLTLALESLDKEREEKAKTVSDQALLDTWYRERVEEETEKALKARLGSIDRMNEEELKKAQATLDVIREIVVARVGAESDAAKAIEAIQTELNMRLYQLAQEGTEAEYEFRKKLGLVSLQEQIAHEQEIAEKSQWSIEKRATAAQNYYGALMDLIKGAKLDELKAIKETLEAQLKKYEAMGEGWEVYLLAVKAALEEVDFLIADKSKGWAARLGESFLNALGDFGRMIQTFQKGYKEGGIWRGLSDVFMELITKSKAFAALLDALNPIIQAVADMFGELIAPLVPLVKILAQFLIPIFKAVGQVFRWVADVVVGIWNAIASVINWALGWLGVHIPTIRPTWREEEGLEEVETPSESGKKQGTQISEITGPTRDLLIELLRPLTVLDSLPVYAMAIEKAIYEMRDAFLAFVGMNAAVERGTAAVINQYHIENMTINASINSKEEFDRLMASLSRRAELAALGSGA
ncbi:MAG TPA: phage tail tape measure protein [Firmicutes bacterium]|nr:phage tail tape measure protein [Bacillota bacterium]